MLQISHIRKSFQQKIIANDINLTVQNGELTALLGASGSGKSTLLNMISGLIAPDFGEIILHGDNITHTPTEKRSIAMMFQDFALLPHLNVWQNVAFGLRLRGISAKNAQKMVYPILDEVGLSYAYSRTIDALSGGEKQRVALARALAGEPKLLLLDEPFSSLDTTLRQQLQTLTRDLVARRNIPALLVTHDPAEACLMAQNIAVLISGCLKQHDTPDILLSAPNCPEVAKLLGCLNVSDAHYLPQRAIELNNENGEICPIQSCFRQPENWRIVFEHPIFGELTAFSSSKILGECRVNIDTEKIVNF